MKNMISTTGLLLLLAATALAQDWKGNIGKYGLRTAQITAEGSTPDGAAQTTLTFQCATGKGAMASIIYSVSGADKMKRFNFEDFEGPDAVAASKKLTTIEVLSTTGEVLSEKTQVSGGFSDGETFAFEVSAKAKTESLVTRIVAAISSHSKITVTVQDNRNPQKVIQTVFSGNGSTEVLKTTMKDCLKPQPRLNKVR